jgi:hypothetical protein
MKVAQGSAKQEMAGNEVDEDSRDLKPVLLCYLRNHMIRPYTVSLSGLTALLFTTPAGHWEFVSRHFGENIYTRSSSSILSP